MTRWWRSHSLRVQLTLWYVFAMVVVLGVYAAAVYTFVSRSVSESLDQRLRLRDGRDIEREDQAFFAGDGFGRGHASSGS